MAELCENCGRLMEAWDATHCSEECILATLQYSKSFAEGNEKIDNLIKKNELRKSMTGSSK